jgi:hypothetical protein
MRLLLYSLAIFFVFLSTGCYTKYPLNQQLEHRLDSISNTHNEFYKSKWNGEKNDTTTLTKEQFRQEGTKFLSEFPNVMDKKGSVYTDNHKYQGKRKFITYTFDAPKGQSKEISVFFHINDKDEDILSSVYYTHGDESDSPNPILMLNIEFSSQQFSIKRGRTGYERVWWK